MPTILVYSLNFGSGMKNFFMKFKEWRKGIVHSEECVTQVFSAKQAAESKKL
jgi:hypothetical protein